MIRRLLIALVVWVLASTSASAQTFVQSKQNAVTGTTLGVLLNAQPINGNLLVACIFTRASTLTNPMGWTTAIEVFNATESDYVRIAYKVAGALESPTINFTQASDTGMITVAEWSGLNTPTLDQNASTGRTTGVTSLSTATTGTTTAAAEVAISCHGMRADVTSPSLTNSFTVREFRNDATGMPPSNTSVLMGDKVLSATGTQETTASWTTSATAMGAIATFKASITSGFVQEQFGTALGTSVTATYSAPPTSGNLMVACMFSRATTLTNPTGWTTAVEAFNATESDYVRIAYKVAGGSEPSAVTFGQSPSDSGILSITEWTGLTNATHDQIASTGRTAGAVSLSSGTTPTTTANDEVVIACFGTRIVVSGEAVSGSFAIRETQDFAGAGTLIAADRITTATGAQATTASWTEAAVAMGAIASFKSSGGGGGGGSSGPPIGSRGLLGVGR